MDQPQGSATATQPDEAAAEICLTCMHLPGCETRAKQRQPHPLLRSLRGGRVECGPRRGPHRQASRSAWRSDLDPRRRSGELRIPPGIRASARRGTNRSIARRHLRRRHVLQGLQPGTEGAPPVFGLRRHRVPRPQRSDGRGGVQAHARYRTGRHHRGPRVFPGDRQLPRRLRPRTHRRGGRSLFSRR